MLSKLTDCFNKIVLESTEDPWIRKITSDTDFYNQYLKDLSKKYDIVAVKARVNVFRLIGSYKNVIDALNNFTVDELYWDESTMNGKFVVFSPMVTFCDSIYNMNFDEGHPNNVSPNSLYAYQNFSRQIIQGRWYVLNELEKSNDFDYPVHAKMATPKELAQMIEKLANELGYIDFDKIHICVEFVLNCENRFNQVFDETSVFLPTENSDKENYDYNFSAENPDEFIKNRTVNVDGKIDDELKSNTVSFSKPIINTYDKKNKFKKTQKEVR